MRVLPLAAAFLLVGLAGCLDGADGHHRCGPTRILALQEVPSASGFLVRTDRNETPLAGYLTGFVQGADRLASEPRDEALAWNDDYYPARRLGNTTEFDLRPLEWIGLQLILDDAAVAQGGASTRPFGEHRQSRFAVGASDRTFEAAFYTLDC